MKKIVCDRCGKEATHKINDGLKEVDLCELCYNDFKIFLERKPLIDLRSIFK